MEVGERKSTDDNEMDTGRMEAGRRQGGGRSEEFYLKGHSKGMQIPKFRRADLRNLVFKSYLSKKIIKGYSELYASFYPAKIQKN
jgi:hypothetical protein